MMRKMYVYNVGNCCNWSSGSFTCLPPPKSPRLVAGCQRKSTADSQQLQNDLRRLLNADSKENLFEATSVSANCINNVNITYNVNDISY